MTGMALNGQQSHGKYLGEQMMLVRNGTARRSILTSRKINGLQRKMKNSWRSSTVSEASGVRLVKNFNAVD